MHSQKTYPEHESQKFSPETEWASPFIEGIYSEEQLEALENMNTPSEVFQQESPFIKVFENVELGLDESKTQEFDNYLYDVGEEIDQEEKIYGEENYLGVLDDEIDPPVEESEPYDEEALSHLEYGLKEVYDEDEATYVEEEEVKEENVILPRMKFEFQTSNRIWRNDGHTPPSLLERKYGPKDFLVDEGEVRLESETGGVLEFETEWIRKWSALEEAINKAVKMTDAMNDSPPSRLEKKRKAFPFNVDHLRIGSAKEKKQGFWDRKSGKEGENEKILGAKEELEVEITDHVEEWQAGIQSSESFLLHQYESYLRQHEWPYFRDGAIRRAKAILDAANTKGIPATELVKLRNFLQIIVNYIMRGQGGKASKDAGAFDDVKGIPSKQAFTLMNRTSFSSIYRRLLGREERRLFYKIVRNDVILNMMGLNRESPFFIEGYGSKRHQAGPTVYNWLVGIYNGKDLLSGRSGKGLSASMGRYNVEARKGKKDRWLVKFETRNTIMGATGIEAKDWLSYVSKLYILASERRRRPASWVLLPLERKVDRFLDLIATGDVRSAISLAHQRGVSDENKLTNLVFHSLHLELGGRRIRKEERALAKKWLRIRNNLVRPFLQSEGPHETMEFVSEALQKEAGLAERFVDDSEGETHDEYFPETLDEYTGEAKSHEALRENVAEAFDDPASIGALEEQEVFEEALDDEFSENEYVDDELDEAEAFHHGELWEDQDGFEVTDDPFDAEDVDGDDVLDELEELESDEFHESETGSRTADYDKALKRALKNPKPGAFAAPWRRDGGKFDTRYWKKRVDLDPGWYIDGNGKWKRHRWSMLEIINDGDAYDAIKAIIAHPEKWTYDCAVFVQAAHLYALAVSRGKHRTNAYYAKKKLRLRFHSSPGLRTRKSYRKDARNGPWRVRSGGSKRKVMLSAAKVLRSAPFGSRVMWHNVKGSKSWKNENTVKVGNNSYRGFPLFGARPAKGWKIQMGLAAHQVYKDDPKELEGILKNIEFATGADVKNKKKLQSLWNYTKQHVYLREVTIIGPDPHV